MVRLIMFSLGGPFSCRVDITRGRRERESGRKSFKSHLLNPSAAYPSAKAPDAEVVVPVYYDQIYSADGNTIMMRKYHRNP